MATDADVYTDTIFFNDWNKVRCRAILFDGGRQVCIGYFLHDGTRTAVRFNVPKDILKEIGNDLGYKC